MIDRHNEVMHHRSYKVLIRRFNMIVEPIPRAKGTEDKTCHDYDSSGFEVPLQVESI